MHDLVRTSNQQLYITARHHSLHTMPALQCCTSQDIICELQVVSCKMSCELEVSQDLPGADDAAAYHAR